MVTAAETQKWSAVGRPEWVQRQHDHIHSLMLTVFGTEGRSVYRCLVMAIVDDKSKCCFTLDVSTEDFDRLPDVSMENVVSLAHKYLASFPPLELDPAQKETWRRWREKRRGGNGDFPS